MCKGGEVMAHIRCDFRSEALDMFSSMTVMIPDGVKSSQVPVVYLLHGLADNCTGWSRFTSVERYARFAGAAVVIPEVQRSFYTDERHGLKYFTFISRELRKICHNLFGFSTSGDKNYIMGFSMGGYGALKCVLTRPGSYAGCAVFSSVTDLRREVLASEGQRRKEYKAIFTENLNVPASSDLFCLLEKVKGEGLPDVFMTCGLSDSFLEQNRRFFSLLEKKASVCSLDTWAGGHEWPFWDESVKKAFDHFFPGKVR